MTAMNTKFESLRYFVSMVLILLSICCHISLTSSFPVLDPSQIDILIDPLHQASDLESKRVVAKSVFNTPIRTPAPFINKCPPGHHSRQPGGPCIQSLVFIQNDSELLGQLTKKFLQDNPKKKKPTGHRHRTSTLRTPTETVPTTSESTTEWTTTSGESGAATTEFTTTRTSSSIVDSGDSGKFAESAVDTMVTPMGSASMSDLPNHSSQPQPFPQQQSQQQQQHTDNNKFLGTGSMGSTESTVPIPTILEKVESENPHPDEHESITATTVTSFSIITDDKAISIANSTTRNATNTETISVLSKETVLDTTQSPEETMLLLPDSFPGTVTPDLPPESDIQTEPQRNISSTGTEIFSNDTDATDSGDIGSQEFDQMPLSIETLSQDDTNSTSELNPQQIQMEIIPHGTTILNSTEETEAEIEPKPEGVFNVNNDTVTDDEDVDSIVVHNNTEKKVQNNEINFTSIMEGLASLFRTHPNFNADDDVDADVDEEGQLNTSRRIHRSNQTEETLLPLPLESIESESEPESEKNPEAIRTQPIFVEMEERTTIVSPLGIEMEEMGEINKFATATTTTVYFGQSLQTPLVTDSNKSMDEKLQLPQPTSDTNLTQESSSTSLKTSDSEMNAEFIPSLADIYKATMPPTIFYEPDHPNPGLHFKDNNNNNVHFVFSNMRRTEESRNMQHQPRHHEYYTSPASASSFWFLQG